MEVIYCSFYKVIMHNYPRSFIAASILIKEVDECFSDFYDNIYMQSESNNATCT